MPVVPRATPLGELAELTLTVTGGTPLAPPVPPRGDDPLRQPAVTRPHECRYRFTDDPWNDAQTIGLGAAPRPLSLEEFAPHARPPFPATRSPAPEPPPRRATWPPPPSSPAG